MPTLFYPKVRDDIYKLSQNDWHKYLKPSQNEFIKKLESQLKHFKIGNVGNFDQGLNSSDVVLDAIFGFSFKGDPRPPFDTVIESLKNTDKPIVSVDIPSAWELVLILINITFNKWHQL